MLSLRLFPLLVCVLLSSCTFIYDTATWIEDVVISDGEVIQVERQTRRWGWGLPGVTPGGLISYKLNAPDMPLQWESGPSSLNEPVAFDVIDGYPVLVLYDSQGLRCGDKGLNDYAAQVFVYTDTGWREISPQEAPLDRMHKNLFDGQWGVTNAQLIKPYMDLRYKQMVEQGTEYLALAQWFAAPGRTCRYHI